MPKPDLSIMLRDGSAEMELEQAFKLPN